MKKEALTSILAILVFTLLLGIAYPLAVTGVSQVAFNDKANGSMLEVDGKVVGSSLIAQQFKGDRWFHPRPSQTDFNPSATAFNNAGPNAIDTRDAVRANVTTYLASERRFNPGLTRADLPVDAVTGSGSGVDPQISIRNAEIQARRIAQVRKIDAVRLHSLIERSTEGRGLGVFGEPGVNVLKLNIAIQKEAAR